MRWEPFDWEIKDQLALLRANDVVTYCFHVGPGGLAPKGHVEDSVWEAKENGIKFDIGHGMNSFNFEVAETAIREGFLPDSISTDFYYRHTNTLPVHDVPHTISKLIASGMNQNDAFERATFSPAKILGQADQIGTLSIGSVADIVVVEQNTKNSELIDVNGNKRSGKLWEPVLTVKSGEII
jgi:dihydroorotase